MILFRNARSVNASKNEEINEFHRVENFIEKIWDRYGFLAIWMQAMNSYKNESFHLPPFGKITRTATSYFSLFCKSRGMDRGLQCFHDRMKFAEGLAALDHYQLVVLIMKLVVQITSMDSNLCLNKYLFKIIKSLDGQLDIMVGNIGLEELAELMMDHITEDFPRLSTVFGNFFQLKNHNIFERSNPFHAGRVLEEKV